MTETPKIVVFCADKVESIDYKDAAKLKDI